MESLAMHSNPVRTSWFADIFNLSLLHSEVPTCFKKTAIIPVPNKIHAMCLNGYHPVALTSVIKKCLESKTKELIIDFMKNGGGHAPICINRTEVEMVVKVDSIKFLKTESFLTWVSAWEQVGMDWCFGLHFWFWGTCMDHPIQQDLQDTAYK
eukprot:g38772.t1